MPFPVFLWGRLGYIRVSPNPAYDARSEVFWLSRSAIPPSSPLVINERATRHNSILVLVRIVIPDPSVIRPVVIFTVHGNFVLDQNQRLICIRCIRGTAHYCELQTLKCTSHRGLSLAIIRSPVISADCGVKTGGPGCAACPQSWATLPRCSEYLLPWHTPSARFSDHVLKSLSKMPPCVSSSPS